MNDIISKAKKRINQQVCSGLIVFFKKKYKRFKVTDLSGNVIILRTPSSVKRQIEEKDIIKIEEKTVRIFANDKKEGCPIEEKNVTEWKDVTRKYKWRE